MKKDIQVKFKIDNIRKFMDKLQLLNYVLIGGNFEKITRYDDEKDSLSNNGIFIRTKSGIDEVVTIKEKSMASEKYKYFKRDALSMEVENCDVLDHIFRKIGLTNLYIMEKYRLTFKNNKSIICIDELPFGVYCDIIDTEKNIDRLLKIFNIDDFYNTTYWEIYEKLSGIVNPKKIIFEKDHIFMLASL